MSEDYVKRSLNKVSSLATAAKVEFLAGNTEEALEMIESMQSKLRFIHHVIKNDIKVPA